ncbi:hypothetical protein [Ectobacillus ponti]|uniref:Uncharacterized protein n=1 Tax=Ectobacillus ponti TaxID=2961894 RepID=A0AA41X7W3_9BACI|nr:hypothetical protein [Ectobacillus ponti]MCP8968793.1 hypothetical protein [Ectobacillus ponti]
MEMVSKHAVLNGMDSLLNTLDLLDMQMTLRINHTVKHKEESLLDRMDVLHVSLTHMEGKLERHLEEGDWLATPLLRKIAAV